MLVLCIAYPGGRALCRALPTRGIFNTSRRPLGVSTIAGRVLHCRVPNRLVPSRSRISLRFIPQDFHTCGKDCGKAGGRHAFQGFFAMDASIWDEILSRVETKVNRHSFYTWFKPTTFVADAGNAITVRVPNTLFKDWLTKHYSLVLSEALAEVRRTGSSLVFVAEGGVVSPPARDEPAPAVDAPGNGGDSATTGG